MSDLESAAVIGVDIGASKIIAGLVTASGGILQTEQVATPSTPSAILAAAQGLCRALLGASDCEVKGIGIGAAGMIDTETGQVIHANDNLPAWTDACLSAISVGQRLPIVVENDVRAMSYGEAVLGAGADYSSLLCVAVGTGIGGGSSWTAKFGMAQHTAPGKSAIWLSIGRMTSPFCWINLPLAQRLNAPTAALLNPISGFP